MTLTLSLTQTSMWNNTDVDWDQFGPKDWMRGVVDVLGVLRRRCRVVAEANHREGAGRWYPRGVTRPLRGEQSSGRLGFDCAKAGRRDANGARNGENVGEK